MNPLTPWLEMWLLCFALFGAAKLAVRLLAFFMRPLPVNRWPMANWRGPSTTSVGFAAPLRRRREEEP